MGGRVARRRMRCGCSPPRATQPALSTRSRLFLQSNTPPISDTTCIAAPGLHAHSTRIPPAPSPSKRAQSCVFPSPVLSHTICWCLQLALLHVRVTYPPSPPLYCIGFGLMWAGIYKPPPHSHTSHLHTHTHTLTLSHTLPPPPVVAVRPLDAVLQDVAAEVGLDVVHVDVRPPPGGRGAGRVLRRHGGAHGGLQPGLLGHVVGWAGVGEGWGKL